MKVLSNKAVKMKKIEDVEKKAGGRGRQQRNTAKIVENGRAGPRCEMFTGEAERN